MSDYKSGQPIRSEKDGLDERVHVKLVDYTAPDGVDNQVQISEKLVHVRVFGEDEGNVKRQVKLSESGNVALDGDYDVANNTNPSTVGLMAHDRNAAKDATHQNKRVSAVDSSVDSDVTALDVGIRDEQGNPFTVDNPLPIEIAESAGEEIHDYNASATDVVKDATDTHTYTVPVGKTLLLEQVLCSGSGRAKFEIAVGAAAAEVTKGVRFVSSSNNDSDLTLKRTIKVAAGENVLITRLNRDNQPQALYTTIVGVLK